MEEKYNKTLEQIKEVLREEDLMGLINIGAPPDEYNSESLMVFERVYRLDSIDTIKDKIWDVFYLQFCYGSVFQMVNGELTEIYKEPVSREEAHKQIGSIHKYTQAAEKIKNIIDS